MRRIGPLRLRAGIFNRVQRSQVGDPPVAPASFEAREPAAERVKRHDNRDPGDINPKEADTETFRRRSAGSESRHLPQAEAAR